MDKKIKAVTKGENLEIQQVMGEQLRILRTSRRMTREILARKIGCTENAISKWESGERAISPNILEMLIEIFNVDFNHFYGHNTPEVKDEKIRELFTNYQKAEARANRLWEEIMKAFATKIDTLGI